MNIYKFSAISLLDLPWSDAHGIRLGMNDGTRVDDQDPFRSS